jgi:hypothetical protein
MSDQLDLKPVHSAWVAYRKRVLTPSDTPIEAIEVAYLAFMCGAYHAWSLMSQTTDPTFGPLLREATAAEMRSFSAFVTEQSASEMLQ